MIKGRNIFKPLFAVCLVIIFVCNTFDYSFVLATDDNKDMVVDLANMYRKYDLTTGEVTFVPKYAPPAYRDGERMTYTNGYAPNQNTEQKSIGTITFGEVETIDNDVNKKIDLSKVYRRYDNRTGETFLVPRDAPPAYRDGKRMTSTEGYEPLPKKELPDVIKYMFSRDNRIRVTSTTSHPFYGLARLYVTYTDETFAFGTGFMVSENVMLTAGHMCMSENSNAPISSMSIYLGQDDMNTPVNVSLSTYYVCANFSYYNDAQNDYAILVLNSNPGNTTGWFSLSCENDSFFDDEIFAITGYPEDKQQGTMWTASGNISSYSANKLYYDIDCVATQSGSPIRKANTVYGIHVTEKSPDNVGYRITQELLDWLAYYGNVY